MKLPFQKWRHTERGSFTLEASCVLLLFAAAVSVLFSLCNVLRAERAVQLALDKTAMEISEYCYPAAAIGDALGDRLQSTVEKKENNGEKVSFLLKAGQGLLSMGRGSDTEMMSAPDAAKDLFDKFSKGFDISDPGSAVDAVRGALSSYGDTPIQAMIALASGIGKYEASGLLSHAVAVPLCELMVPKAFSADNPDAFLRNCGVDGGLSGLDYSMSSVLPDGNDIRLCAVYEIHIGGSLFPWKMQVIQSASTASWCSAGVKKTSSIWSLAGLARGKKFVSIAKKAEPSLAVKAGVGFDLYDTGNNRVTSVISLNVFAETYSKCTAGAEGEEKDAAKYSLQEKQVKTALKNAAKKLKTAVGKLKNGQTVRMENGGDTAFRSQELKKAMKVYIPEEASVFSDRLDEIGAAVEKETGVQIAFERKEKALG